MLRTPDITPAQIVSGIPILAKFGAAFEIYTLNAAQQEALSELIPWAMGLLFADTVIRAARAVSQALRLRVIPADDAIAPVEDEPAAKA